MRKFTPQEKTAWCNSRDCFLLNCPFWCQKHHFKPQKRVYFEHRSLIVRRLPWSDPNSSVYGLPGDPVFAEFIIEGTAADPQPQGSLFFIPVTLLQNMLEQLFLIFHQNGPVRFSRN
jgi:hypothetical protein